MGANPGDPPPQGPYGAQGAEAIPHSSTEAHRTRRILHFPDRYRAVRLPAEGDGKVAAPSGHLSAPFTLKVQGPSPSPRRPPPVADDQAAQFVLLRSLLGHRHPSGWRGPAPFGSPDRRTHTGTRSCSPSAAAPAYTRDCGGGAVCAKTIARGGYGCHLVPLGRSRPRSRL